MIGTVTDLLILPSSPIPFNCMQLSNENIIKRDHQYNQYKRIFQNVDMQKLKWSYLHAIASLSSTHHMIRSRTLDTLYTYSVYLFAHYTSLHNTLDINPGTWAVKRNNKNKDKNEMQTAYTNLNLLKTRRIDFCQPICRFHSRNIFERNLFDKPSTSYVHPESINC